MPQTGSMTCWRRPRREWPFRPFGLWKRPNEPPAQPAPFTRLLPAIQRQRDGSEGVARKLTGCPCLAHVA